MDLPTYSHSPSPPPSPPSSPPSSPPPHDLHSHNHKQHHHYRTSSSFGLLDKLLPLYRHPREDTPTLAGSKHERDEHNREHDKGNLKTRRFRGAIRRNKKKTAGIACCGLLVVVLAVVLPVVLVKKMSGGGDLGGGGSGGSGVVMTGSNGSTIHLQNGTSFTYLNPFSGIWVSSPPSSFPPYAASFPAASSPPSPSSLFNAAYPNTHTPPLNQSWDWATDTIQGVNLGGWLVLEPFITPDIFARYPGAADEYTLSVMMRADEANGGIGQIEMHYDTFITEQDIAEIASAGLNWIRVPIPHWAIETWESEPYLEGVAWKYLLRMLEWARKYGLRVLLDLHTVPGSQNGYNHSGKLAPVSFLSSPSGLYNAQRTLYYIRILTAFIAQPAYTNLIPAFGIVNEALVGVIGMDVITSFYLEALKEVREVGGGAWGEGNGPYVVIHDGFQALSVWNNYLEGADRLVLDTHPYFSFGGPMLSPIAVPQPGNEEQAGGVWPLAACANWGPSMNDSRKNFGVSIAGEFSGSPNDCGLWLRGVNATSTNPDCGIYNDWRNYNDTMKEGVRNFVEASFDALQNWFFWTWKIGPSQTSGEIETPLWSYQLGFRNGWIPPDPRVAIGTCQSLGAPSNPFNNTFASWQTGGLPSTTIAASSSASFPWPPTTISNAGGVPVSLLPTLTATGTPISVGFLPTGFPGAVGGNVVVDGEEGEVTVAGCVYPSEYGGSFVVVPTAPCTGGQVAAAAAATATPAV